MFQFTGNTLVVILNDIEYFRNLADERARSNGPSSNVQGMEKEHLEQLLEKASKFCKGMEMPESMGRIVTIQNRLVPFFMAWAGGASHQIMVTELAGLQVAFERELAHKKFIYMLPDEIKFFEQEALFGQAANDAFPSAKSNIKQAGNCLAADLNTAAVFHLMRVVEVGLHSIAKHPPTQITTNLPLQDEKWNAIITRLEAKVKAIKQTGASTAKTDEIEFYDGTLVEFNYFKDVWRNHVAHSQQPYDHNTALSVFEHVGNFMRRLATRIKE